MMKTKDTITVNLGDETKRIEAYILKGELEGLAVHRQMKYVPGREEHKFTSRWQLTHISSGKALLRPDECVETMKQALGIAAKLKEYDWTQDSGAIAASPGIRNDIVNALAGVESEAPEAEGSSPSTASRRYVVRRNKEHHGYDIWDTDTESTVITITHRGFAAEKARELNQGGV